ncbi:MAG: 3-isopropylmalate dehydratase small subunit [Tepidanaerobacteraceae bacterium]|jgi:3-isopropylmalate/(R)-2-methylmalate dehydratase small subunit|nr:3-isopropylmalate dehydratase small subunit [Thermoanaerobacterales bacterium]
MIIEGKVWTFGDNIDTDVIIPARYLNTTDPQELAAHCLEDANPEFSKKVKKGDIIVAGNNFGCGSSREHAPIAIKAVGISCVIASSFARIFYRNSINIGLSILEFSDGINKIKNSDELNIDTDKGIIKNLTTGENFKARPFPDFIKEIINAGGLLNYAVKEDKGV